MSDGAAGQLCALADSWARDCVVVLDGWVARDGPRVRPSDVILSFDTWLVAVWGHSLVAMSTMQNNRQVMLEEIGAVLTAAGGEWSAADGWWAAVRLRQVWINDAGEVRRV